MTDFKGKTLKEQQRRLVLLSVWGHQRHFGTPIADRRPIIAIARRLGFWNTSFSNLVTEMERDLLIKSDDGLRVAPGAEEEVDRILDDIQNTEPKGYSASARTRRKPPAKNQEPKGNSEKVALQDWLSRDIDLADFDVRDLQKAKPRQKVEFALWVLKAKLGVEKALLGQVIDFLTTKFPTIGGNSRRSLQRAAANIDYIERTSQNECVLTKKGQEDIEALLPENLTTSRTR